MKYKLHTPAEDLTKNRATRKDVVKFALFQQACQCILGYLTAGPDHSVPHEYAIAVWVQKIGYSQVLATKWMRHAGIDITRIVSESTKYGSSYVGAFLQDTPSSNMGNFSQVVHAPTGMEGVYFSSWETGAAKGIYWVLVPLLQYVSAMVLADTFQYFTHRAFHVNKWLYSKFAADVYPLWRRIDISWQSTSTRCTMKYTSPLLTAPSTTIHWRRYQ